MADTVEGYAKRPVGYMYVDGIYEMFMGIVFLGTVLLDPVWSIVLAVIAYGSTCFLKKRITYPRTGYVKLQSQTTKAWMGGIAGAAAAVGAFFAFRGASRTLMVLLIAAIWAFLYAYISRLAKLDCAWRRVVTLAMVAGPVFISLLPLTRPAADRMGIGFVALLFLVSGAITFVLYLHRSHPPEQVAE